MSLVLDTSGYSLFDAGLEGAIKSMESASIYSIPSVVWGELLSGFKRGSRHLRNLKRLNEFCREFDVEVIEVDQGVAEIYSNILIDLRKKGRPIPTNDLWIAASCLAVEGTLLTADGHFKEVKGLRVDFLDLPS